jgi:hypothetical protein
MRGCDCAAPRLRRRPPPAARLPPSTHALPLTRTTAPRPPGPNFFKPPNSIHAPFYPSLGPYSSSDPIVMRVHFQDMLNAGIGVLVRAGVWIETARGLRHGVGPSWQWGGGQMHAGGRRPPKPAAPAPSPAAQVASWWGPSWRRNATDSQVPVGLRGRGAPGARLRRTQGTGPGEPRGRSAGVWRCGPPPAPPAPGSIVRPPLLLRIAKPRQGVNTDEVLNKLVKELESPAVKRKDGRTLKLAFHLEPYPVGAAGRPSAEMGAGRCGG